MPRIENISHSVDREKTPFYYVIKWGRILPQFISSQNRKPNGDKVSNSLLFKDGRRLKPLTLEGCFDRQTRLELLAKTWIWANILIGTFSPRYLRLLFPARGCECFDISRLQSSHQMIRGIPSKRKHTINLYSSENGFDLEIKVKNRFGLNCNGIVAYVISYTIGALNPSIFITCNRQRGRKNDCITSKNQMDVRNGPVPCEV